LDWSTKPRRWIGPPSRPAHKHYWIKRYLGEISGAARRDYGFAWNPIGANARDFEHFVNLFGYAPAETLMAATKYGGEIMDMGNELGLVKEGYLADLNLDRRDPTKDIRLSRTAITF
jgi:imidazolonepropionase-like amidohydrolase